MTVGRVLYLGGARSGKSRLAEDRVAHLPATYVATARQYPDDPEWAERVSAHRARRPAYWTTRETTDLLPSLAEASPERPVLIDCLTLWLTGQLDEMGAWHVRDTAAVQAEAASRVEALAEAVAAASGVVLVTNEVGGGLVPETRSGRLFRDLLGSCNVRIAAACDEVVLVVAGCPVAVKRPGESG